MKEHAAKLVGKAAGAIRVAEDLLKLGHIEHAAGRAYYAMFYSAEALLYEKGFRSRKHRGIHSLFAEHFAKPRLIDPKFHRWLVVAFEARLEGDYGVDVKITRDEIEEMIAQAQEFLREAERFLATGA